MRVKGKFYTSVVRPAMLYGAECFLEIEISVLDALRPVGDPGEIEIGRHGLFISLGTRRGLLLPQVAVEHGWDRATFLSEACRKADLDPDAWRHGARIEVFSAQILSAPGGAG